MGLKKSKCLVYDCKKTTRKSIYCTTHKCAEKICEEKVMQLSLYCKLHTCAAKLCHNKIYACGYCHKCFMYANKN